MDQQTPTPPPDQFSATGIGGVAWLSTSTSAGNGPVRYAGTGAPFALTLNEPGNRKQREDEQEATLCPEATRARGAGTRPVAEAPDPNRTCFERDRDRVLHSSAFRRLAGKTQVHVDPTDHQRTRLTHALEVAQIAVEIAARLRLNTTLTQVGGLAHDLGHACWGHSSEEALDPYLPDGFHHATWGAQVTSADLNLTVEVTDAIANHSWSRPRPLTPEAMVIRWADRIAYLTHDMADAVTAGILTVHDIPEEVISVTGSPHQRSIIAAFIEEVVVGTHETGTIGMRAQAAEALTAFRRHNYERIYARPASLEQGQRAVEVVRSLVDWYIDHPDRIPDRTGTNPVEHDAVAWVAGMTDRYAARTAVTLLGWDPHRLPAGIASLH